MLNCQAFPINNEGSPNGSTRSTSCRNYIGTDHSDPGPNQQIIHIDDYRIYTVVAVRIPLFQMVHPANIIQLHNKILWTHSRQLLFQHTFTTCKCVHGSFFDLLSCSFKPIHNYTYICMTVVISYCGTLATFFMVTLQQCVCKLKFV